MARKINEHPETILEKIRTSIDGQNYIVSLLLEHSTLESYMRDLLLITLSRDSKISKGLMDNFKRLNFDYVLTLNSITGAVDKNLYSKIKEFSKNRNKFVHELIGYDFTIPAVKSEIKELAQKGFTLCKQLSKTYEDFLYDQYEDFSDHY